MAITQISRDWPAYGPAIVRIITTSTLAQVATAGYLTAQAANISLANNGPFEWDANDFVLVSASDGKDFFYPNASFTSLTLYSTAGNGAVTLPVVSGDFTVFDGTLGALKDAGYSASDATKTKVAMLNGAVILNHIATYKDTAGTIGEDAAVAINGGGLQAGLSGTAGTVASFPSVATSGSLILAAVTNSSGNFNTTISNASAVAQAQVVSIPDGGTSTSNFLISNSGGTQTIATGSLALTLGNITLGSSGHAGTVTSFPAAAANGTLILAAQNNSGGNFSTTISNAASVGQSQVMSIPDVGASTGQFIVKTAALVSGNYLMASGTAGVVVDSGVPATAGRQFAQVSMTAAQFNGMYAAPFLLVAAPGANKMIVVESMQLCMTYVSANYASGGIVYAQYDSTANGAGVKASNTEAAADFQAAASTVFTFIGTSGNTVGVLPFSTCANKGLYLSNFTGAFTTGDSTWIVKVFYHIVSTNS